MACFAAGVAGAGDRALAQEPPQAAVPAVPADPAVAEASRDPALRELATRLSDLLAGRLSVDVGIDGLFNVPLDDLPAVERRRESLALERSDHERRLADLERELALGRPVATKPLPPPDLRPPESDAPGDPSSPGSGADAPTGAPTSSDAGGSSHPAPASGDPGAAPADVDGRARSVAEPDPGESASETSDEVESEAPSDPPEPPLPPPGPSPEELARERERIDRLRAEKAMLELRLQIARDRQTYLDGLSRMLSAIPVGSRDLIRALGLPRGSLRERGRVLRQTGLAANALAARVDLVAARLDRRALVGFVGERRALAEALPALGTSLRARGTVLETRAQELLDLAIDLETQGKQIRRAVLTSAASTDPSTVIDALFLDHLREQRRARSEIREGADDGSADAVELEATLRGLIASPAEIGTTDEAERAVEAATAALEDVDRLLDARGSQVAGWRLAFENDLVAPLAALASRTARQQGYAWSREVVEDVQSELARALLGARAWEQERRALLRDVSTGLFSRAGAAALPPFAGLVGIWLGWLYVRRRNSTIVARGVRLVSRRPFMKGRLGAAVRWAGLVQAILPAALLYPAVDLTERLLGRDSIEARVLDAAFVPVFLYVLGRQTILGLTRQVTRGRPALLSIPPLTVERIKESYDRLGIVIASAAVLGSVLRSTIGVGRIVTIADALAITWIGIWIVVEAGAWRVPLAEAWLRSLSKSSQEGREGRLARWMSGTWLGIAIAPVAFSRTFVTQSARGFGRLQWTSSILRRLRTMSLRRAARLVDETAPSRTELPDDYRSCFPLYPILGDKAGILIPREAVVEAATQRVERWRNSQVDGSLVLIGQKGIGKTTLANMVARRLGSELPVTELTIRGKPLRESELLGQLAAPLGSPVGTDLDSMIEALRTGPPRAVFVDEAHNVFLRIVDGYGAYDALVKLVGATSKNVFWVLLFNSFTWQFLQASRARVHSLHTPIEVPPWSRAELQLLIQKRHASSGYALEFDEILLAEEGSSGGLELVEEAEGYFRLIWDMSGGNPRVATRLWLASLELVGEKKIRIGLVRDDAERRLDRLSDEHLFALAAICQHENLNPGELARVLNLSDDFARYAMRHLGEARLIEPKSESEDRAALSSDVYPEILRVLRSKHLIFE